MTRVSSDHLLMMICMVLLIGFVSSSAFAQKQPATCDITKPTPDAEFVALAAHSGASLSNLALNDQSRLTTVVDISLAETDRPLYLVLAGYNQIIWNVSGNRPIERVIVLSTLLKGTWSGIVGVPKEKVQFADANICRTPYDAVASGRAGDIFGRQPDLKGSERVVDRIKVGQRIEVFTGKLPRTRNLGPDFYFQGLENALFGGFPGGLARLNRQMVASDTSVEAYDIAPSYAGLVELLRSGKVAPVTKDEQSIWRDGFRKKYPAQMFEFQSRGGRGDYEYIIRAPVTLPVGLSTKFLLASGVPMPQGIKDDFRGCVLVLDDFSAVPDKCNPFGGGLAERLRAQNTSLASDGCRQTEVDQNVTSNLGLYAFVDRDKPRPKDAAPLAKIRLQRPGRHHIVILGLGPRTAWEIEAAPGSEIAGILAVRQPSLSLRGLGTSAKVVMLQESSRYQPDQQCTEYQAQIDPRQSGLHEQILDNSILAYTGRRLDEVVAATIGQETLID